MVVNGTPWETRYRQALLDQPLVSKVTLADGQSVGVKDIYVQRTLLHEVVQKQPEREITVKLPVDLWPKLQDERVVLVEGPAGMGKSTLTKQLVRESETHRFIPIWIPFRLFVASGLTILEYLDQRYIPWLGLSDLRVPNRADETGRDHSLGQWCYDQWQSGLAVLILDGLDEVFRHEERVATLKGLPITGTGRIRPFTILTSRPLSQSLPLQKATVEVQGLTPSDQQQFIKQYRASLQLTNEQVGHFTRATTEREHSRFQVLLTRPGHLIQILTTYARTNTILDRETAVLNNLLESRLSITDRSEPPVDGDDAKKKRQVLMSMALHLSACRQGQRQTRAQLLALIQQVLHEQKQVGTPLFPLSQTTAILNDLTRNSGLLSEVGPEIYEFETVIWLQHLTGSALADKHTIAALGLTESDVLDYFDKKAWDPEWEPVLKSWVGNGKNPFPLFDRLMEKQHDDLARHRLGVAGRCLSELRPEQRSQPPYQRLTERIPTESFALWKRYEKRDAQQLVTTSLGTAWVQTEVGQTKLIGLLSSRDPMRRAAAWALGRLGSAMPVDAQRALVARLWDSNKEVRTAAADVLNGLGGAMAAPVQLALVMLLGDSNEDLREAAGVAFKGLGGAMAVPVQETLMAMLMDPDEDMRWLVIKALRNRHEVIPVLVQQALVARLGDPIKVIRNEAALALADLGLAMAVSVQQALVTLLGNPNEGVRAAAAAALDGLRLAMPVAVQWALEARLGDSNEDVRLAAACVLGDIEVAMVVSVRQALEARLADSNEDVRAAAGVALSRLNRRGAKVFPSFERLDVAMRREAISAIEEPGVTMPVDTQQMVAAWIVDSNNAPDWLAVKCLRKLGRAMAVPVQQFLVARLTDSSGGVREALVEALGGLGVAMPDLVQQALEARLADSNQDVRRAAIRALGGLGSAMPVSVQQALMAQLADPDWEVRHAVVEAIGKLGAAMPVAVQQALVAQLVHRGWFVRQASDEALSSAQLQGLRLFLSGTEVRESRLVTELSTTVPFSDWCHDGIVHASTALAISAHHRLPLTVV